jgi:hypothetical protein
MANWPMVGNFGQKNICQKIHISLWKNPYKISARYFFASKNLYLLHARKAAIFGTFFVCRERPTTSLTRTFDESEKPNRFAV